MLWFSNKRFRIFHNTGAVNKVKKRVGDGTAEWVFVRFKQIIFKRVMFSIDNSDYFLCLFVDNWHYDRESLKCEIADKVKCKTCPNSLKCLIFIISFGSLFLIAILLVKT